jgi:hypothetical protein
MVTHLLRTREALNCGKNGFDFASRVGHQKLSAISNSKKDNDRNVSQHFSARAEKDRNYSADDCRC